MAHRIAKKTQAKHQTQPNQTQAESPTYYPNQQQPANNSQNKLPRPLLPSSDSIYTHDKSSYRQGKLAFPPVQSLFISHNNYDAGPDFLRPTSALTFGNPRKSSFPLGVWITPFGSDRVHKVRVNSPLRCTRCKAYVNAYFRFDGSKTSAVCNICGINFHIDNATVDQNNLNNTQISTEGVIDFIVKDKIFMKKRTDLIKVLLAIQSNSFIYQSGAFSTIIQSTKAAIQNTVFEKNIRVGVIIFNGQGITYLKLNKNLSKKAKQGQEQTESSAQRIAKKYTVKYSNQGLCCPLSDKQMLFDPVNQKQLLLNLIDSVAEIAQEQYKNSKFQTYGANYAVVLKTIMQNFESQVGRVMLFTHTAPRSGPLAIRARNQQDNKLPLKPLSADYFQLSKQLSKARIGVDMYIISKQVLSNQQLPTTHYLASNTGGSIHFYSPYSAQNHSQNLYYNIYGSFSRKYVYDVNFTARFSNGLNVSSFGTADGTHQVRDISLGMMDPASSVVVNFQQEEKIQENSAAFVQFAIMFTTGDGDRIIRIINYRYQITNKIDQIYQGCDYLAVSNIIMRQAVHKMLRGDPTKVRQQVVNRLISMVAQYVQQGGNRIKISSFMAHPNLCPAFAYIHTFIDSKVFLNHLKVVMDYQICQALKVTSTNFLGFANFFYPKLFSLGMQIYDQSPTPGDLIEGQEDIEQSVILPPSLPLTSQSIKRTGVYLNWSTDYLLILVQPQAPSDLLTQIFGTDNWQQIQQLNSIPELETAHNIRINMIIQQLRRRTSRCNGIFLPFIIRTPAKKGPFNDLLHMVLKEDYQECRFYTFMDTIHRFVQGKLK